MGRTGGVRGREKEKEERRRGGIMGAGRRSGGEACGGGSGGPWSVNVSRNNERGDFGQCVEGRQDRRCKSFH